MAIVIGIFLFAGILYLTGAAFISHKVQIGSYSFETFLGSMTVVIGTGVAVCAFFMFYYFYASLQWTIKFNEAFQIVYRDYEYVKSQLPKEKVDVKHSPKPTRQRRFYVDTKRLSELCPRREKPAKKYSIKVEDSGEEDADQTNPSYWDSISVDKLLKHPNLWHGEADIYRLYKTSTI